jgi:hypothetical protein
MKGRPEYRKQYHIGVEFFVLLVTVFALEYIDIDILGFDIFEIECDSGSPSCGAATEGEEFVHNLYRILYCFLIFIIITDILSY